MEENMSEVGLREAEKRLERVKNFYRHFIAYITINIVLFGVIATLYNQLGWQDIADQNFQYWYKINLISTPLLWGIGVLIHWFVVFNPLKFSIKGLKPKFMKNWEEKQIKKYLKKNN